LPLVTGTASALSVVSQEAAMEIAARTTNAPWARYCPTVPRRLIIISKEVN